MNKAKKIELFRNELIETEKMILEEVQLINAGKDSKWTIVQLQNVVYPEMKELLKNTEDNKIHCKHGKKHRYLHSTYLLTDCLENLDDTVLGKKIGEIQRIYYKL